MVAPDWVIYVFFVVYCKKTLQKRRSPSRSLDAVCVGGMEPTHKHTDLGLSTSFPTNTTRNGCEPRNDHDVRLMMLEQLIGRVTTLRQAIYTTRHRLCAPANAPAASESYDSEGDDGTLNFCLNRAQISQTHDTASTVSTIESPPVLALSEILNESQLSSDRTSHASIISIPPVLYHCGAVFERESHCKKNRREMRELFFRTGGSTLGDSSDTGSSNDTNGNDGMSEIGTQNHDSMSSISTDSSYDSVSDTDTYNNDSLSDISTDNSSNDSLSDMASHRTLCSSTTISSCSTSSVNVNIGKKMVPLHRYHRRSHERHCRLHHRLKVLGDSWRCSCHYEHPYKIHKRTSRDGISERQQCHVKQNKMDTLENSASDTDSKISVRSLVASSCGSNALCHCSVVIPAHGTPCEPKVRCVMTQLNLQSSGDEHSRAAPTSPSCLRNALLKRRKGKSTSNTNLRDTEIRSQQRFLSNTTPSQRRNSHKNHSDRIFPQRCLPKTIFADENKRCVKQSNSCPLKQKIALKNTHMEQAVKCSRQMRGPERRVRCIAAPSQLAECRTATTSTRRRNSSVTYADTKQVPNSKSVQHQSQTNTSMLVWKRIQPLKDKGPPPSAVMVPYGDKIDMQLSSYYTRYFKPPPTVPI